MIADYDFIKYHLLFERHLARHFENSGIAGSVFTARSLSTPRQVIDLAYNAIAGIYEGHRLVHILPFNGSIGLDALVHLSSVPKGVSIKRETRRVGKDGSRALSYTFNVVYGMERLPTNQMVIIAGPFPEDETKHGFLSIYPGKFAPDFTEKSFWRQHALIRKAKKR